MIDKIQIIKNYICYRNKKYKNKNELVEYQEKKIKKHLKFVTRPPEKFLFRYTYFAEARARRSFPADL